MKGAAVTVDGGLAAGCMGHLQEVIGKACVLNRGRAPQWGGWKKQRGSDGDDVGNGLPPSSS